MDIVLKKVHKSFDGLPLFTGLDLTIKEGVITCMTGRSGLGKTTLLRMLMGLDAPDSGSILGLEGTKFSAVFQEDRLCEALSASANAAIALKKGCSRDASDNILRSLGLSEDLTKPVSELSGGMRRRVAIARALAAEYDVLLLDEPFTGLDAECRDTALGVIKCLSEGKTVVLVSHDREIPLLAGGECIDLDALLPSQM